MYVDTTSRTRSNRSYTVMKSMKAQMYPGEYSAWAHMLQRCYNKKDKDYARYGGRNIYVCASWRNDFDNFYLDMGARPTKLHTLERIDNDKGYYPENCKWATRKEQALNRKSGRVITVNGVSKTAADWAKSIGVSR